MTAKNTITRRAPSRSIRAPEWIESNRGRKLRLPSTTPIMKAEGSSVSTHSGTTSVTI